MNDPKKARGLGRGLAALLGEGGQAATAVATGAAPSVASMAAREVPIERVHPNLRQPRQHYDEAALQALTDSITAQGILQPLVVRPHPERPGDFELVAGERRWRAAQRARLTQVPVVVKELDDRTVLELALVENLQREDLTALEEADAYQRLMSDFGHNQETIAKAIGKSRSHVANTVRLLALPPAVKQLMVDGRLTAGHARALLTASDPVALAQEAVAKALTVRDVERRAQEAAKRPRPVKRAITKDADTKAMERDLSSRLGLKVELQHRAGDEKGALVLHYTTLEQLDDLVARLNHAPH